MRHKLWHITVLFVSVNGGYSEWSGWGSCSVTCGAGVQDRQRRCDSPAPQFGGSDCQSPAEEMRSCLDKPCPSTK